MSRRARAVAGVLILAISVVLLILGYMPLEHVRRSKLISPSDLQLPTPISLHFTPTFVS